MRRVTAIGEPPHIAHSLRAGGRLVMMLTVAGLLYCASPSVAAARGRFAASRIAKPVAACRSTRRRSEQCYAIRQPSVPVTSPDAIGPAYEGGGEYGGFDRENLRSAYKLPEKGGSGQTIAIVDAYNDPNAESDLKTYRSHYGLSECTTADGCFKQVNQKGEPSNYPANNEEWSFEMSLDLDMVSAVCPECHILLIEATNNTELKNFEAAENEAATLGATEISDSWGGPEFSGETSENPAFEHPGIPITVASGDHCYSNECIGYSVPSFPAVVPSVIAVGGTYLKKASNSRGWSESVWPFQEIINHGRIEKDSTGSGCSIYESKPLWQTDKGCSKRTDNDVAAVGACQSPVSIYDSYKVEEAGWSLACGTSAAAPIIAGVEALSSSGARKEGAEAFWKLGSKEMLFDVTEGNDYFPADGSCGSYLCEAKVSYDGPSGWGTPDGMFTSAPAATTGAASGVTETAATLHGIVNPEGITTKYAFEYGTTTSYGSKTGEVSAGEGVSNVEVSASISGLTANTTYHYRIVATNGDGTTHGNDQVFTTTAKGAAPGTSPTAVGEPFSSYKWVYYVGSNGTNLAIWQLAGSGSSFTKTQLGGIVAGNTSPVAIRNAEDGHQSVFYNGGTAVGLWEWNGSAWSQSGLPGVAPAAGTSPAVVEKPSTGEQWTYYVGAAGGICSQYKAAGKWVSGCLGGAVGSSPFALRNAANGHQSVFYNGGTAVGLWEWNGSAWTQSGLPGQAPAAGSGVTAVEKASTGEQWVYYVGSNGYVCQSYKAAGKWTSGCFGGSPAANTTPSAIRGENGHQEVFYNGGSDVYLWEWNGSRWANVVLAGMPAAASTSPAAWEEPRTGDWYAYYQGTGSMIWDWELVQGVGWYNHEL